MVFAQETVYFHDLARSLPTMKGKTVAITGCTSGTGFVLAKHCAQKGATVIMLNRPSERADTALQKVRKVAPVANEIVGVACDLSSFEKVRIAAARILADFADKGLDVLCNNAGIMAMPDEATVDGCDVQMQANHLSHFLLTRELMPLLEKAAQRRGEARIVNHSSKARSYHGQLDPKYFGKNGGNLGGNGCGFGTPNWKRYGQTKLANVAFTYALRDKFEARGSKVKALVAHPGVSATELIDTTVKAGGVAAATADNIVAQSAEDGACGITVCSCAPAVNSGEFYGPVTNSSAGPAQLLQAGPEERLADKASRDRLWIESEKATGVRFVL